METTKNSDLNDEFIAYRLIELKEIDKVILSYQIKHQSTDDKKEMSRLWVINNYKDISLFILSKISSISSITFN